MSARSDENLRGVPMKPYDLIREGLIVFGIIFVLVVVLALVFSSPDYPTVKAQDVANLQPVTYLQTCANILAGNSSLQQYGPPYTSDYGNAQHILGIAPANVLGVSDPINPIQDFIIKPLEKTAIINPGITGALSAYQAASASQQQAWIKNYLAGLDHATVKDGQVSLPAGDYGPVEDMMNAMLSLGKSGLLEGALDNSSQTPFNLNFTYSLLFFQDSVDHQVAGKLDMLGGLWGISHETGPYPGAWWLWPYTFLYQIPPISTSPNGDILAVAIITIIYLFTLFTPFVPLINRIPKWAGIYKWIWRDWYRNYAGKIQ
jgi:hypothetical protein